MDTRGDTYKFMLMFWWRIWKRLGLWYAPEGALTKIRSMSYETSFLRITYQKNINKQPEKFWWLVYRDWYLAGSPWGGVKKSPRNNGFSSKNVIYWKQVNRKYKGSGGNESRMILVNPEIQQIVNKTFKPAWRQIHWSPWDLNVIVLFLDAWYLTQNMTCNNWYLTTVFNL